MQPSPSDAEGLRRARQPEGVPIMTRSISKTISFTTAAFAVTMLASAAIPGAVTSAEAGVKHPRAHRLFHRLHQPAFPRTSLRGRARLWRWRWLLLAEAARHLHWPSLLVAPLQRVHRRIAHCQTGRPPLHALYRKHKGPGDFSPGPSILTDTCAFTDARERPRAATRRCW